MDLKAKDPNTESIVISNDDTATYRIDHKLGTMDVSYVRGTKIQPVGHGSVSGTYNNGTDGDGNPITATQTYPVKKDTVVA